MVRIEELSVLDGFQIAKGLYAVCISTAWLLPEPLFESTALSRTLTALHFPLAFWEVIFYIYAAASFSCFTNDHKWLKNLVSFVSCVIWPFFGIVSIMNGGHVNGDDLFKLMIGFGSLVIMYYRGRMDDA